jgi:hypothetical protein
LLKSTPRTLAKIMFKKSFFRELGKNTGKWASNKIFGDWSTPYRFSNSNSKLAKEALKIEQEISEQQFDNGLESKKLEHRFNEITDINEKKQEIINLALPNDKNSLFEFANFLLSNIYGNGWGDNHKFKHLNAFSNACLIKLKQCKTKFKMMNAPCEVKYIKKEISILKRKRFFEKHGAILALITFMIVCFLLLNAMGEI